MSSELGMVEKLNAVYSDLIKLTGKEKLSFIHELLLGKESKDVIFEKFYFEILLFLFETVLRIEVRDTSVLNPKSSPGDLIFDDDVEIAREMINDVLSRGNETNLAETLIYMLSKTDISKKIKLECGKSLRILLERENGLSSILKYCSDEKLFISMLLIRKDDTFFANICRQIRKMDDKNLGMVIQRLMELNLSLVDKYLWTPYTLSLESGAEKDQIDLDLSELRKYFEFVTLIPFQIENIFKYCVYVGSNDASILLSKNLVKLSWKRSKFSYVVSEGNVAKSDQSDAGKELKCLVKMIGEHKSDEIINHFRKEFQHETHEIAVKFICDNETNSIIRELRTIKTDIMDPEIPAQAYGIVQLVKYMQVNGYQFLENIRVIEGKLESDESFLYHKCIKGLGTLAAKYPAKVIPIILDDFLKSTQKFKMVEVYTDTILKLSDELPKYYDQFLRLFLKSLTTEEGPLIRSTILSSVATICEQLKARVAPWSQNITQSIIKIISSQSEDSMVKRASILVITSLVKNNVCDSIQISELFRCLNGSINDSDPVVSDNSKDLLRYLRATLK